MDTNFQSIKHADHTPDVTSLRLHQAAMVPDQEVRSAATVSSSAQETKNLVTQGHLPTFMLDDSSETNKNVKKIDELLLREYNIDMNKSPNSANTDKRETAGKSEDQQKVDEIVINALKKLRDKNLKGE